MSISVAIDTARHYDAEEALESRLPVCSMCGHRIHDDVLYVINDEIVCVDCLTEHFRRWTEDMLYE